MKATLLLLSALVLVVVSKAEDFKCVDGVPYIENECNNCFCTKAGLGCTEKLCSSHENQALTKCEVGTTWQKGCNTCYCVKDIGTVCENKDC